MACCARLWEPRGRAPRRSASTCGLCRGSFRLASSLRCSSSGDVRSAAEMVTPSPSFAAAASARATSLSTSCEHTPPKVGGASSAASPKGMPTAVLRRTAAASITGCLEAGTSKGARMPLRVSRPASAAAPRRRSAIPLGCVEGPAPVAARPRLRVVCEALSPAYALLAPLLVEGVGQSGRAVLSAPRGPARAHRWQLPPRQDRRVASRRALIWARAERSLGRGPVAAVATKAPEGRSLGCAARRGAGGAVKRAARDRGRLAGAAAAFCRAPWSHPHGPSSRPSIVACNVGTGAAGRRPTRAQAGWLASTS
eukprot:scaffold1259_cov368-Prasinococcus_capsulatus_cf.AAC.6